MSLGHTFTVTCTVYVYVNLHVHVITCMYNYIHVHVHVLSYSYDTTGEFWSKSPLPQIRFQFKVFTQGLLKDDKLIGKVSTLYMYIYMYMYTVAQHSK